MLGWKAQWGYFPDNAVTLDAAVRPVKVDISKFVKTDDGPFVIPTKLDVSKLPIEKPTPFEAATSMEAAMGRTDFLTIYVSPSNSRYDLSSYYINLKPQFPSLFLQCPNLYTHQIGDSDIEYPACVITSLSKVLVFSRFHSAGASTSVIGMDGNLLYFYNEEPGAFVQSQGFIGFLVAHGYDGTKESLYDGNNYSMVRMTQGGYADTWYKFLIPDSNVTNEITSFVNALFLNYADPDYTGPGDNPYQPGGDSGEGDTPPGSFDENSDPIPDSSLPTISAANTGFTRIYNPTLSQVQDLARYLWTDESVVQTIWNHIKQYFEDPMQAIIGFNLVPVKVPDGGSKNFALMYIDTGVSMNVAANQFVDVDCGTLLLERYYGSALDQSPYTRVSCYLPYIGTVRLNTDEVMGAELHVKYRVDIVSGSCVAKILVDGNVLYQYSGHCAINIPISSADFSSYVSSVISVAKLAVGAAVAGGAGVIGSASVDPDQQTNRVVTINRTTTQTKRNPATGRQITAGTRSTVETREYPVKQDTTKASFDALSPQNISNTVGQIMSSKPSIEHSGSFSGNTGYLGIRRPYLIIERPNMCMPELYQHFNGFPSMITSLLSACNGYTRIQQVELTGLTATNPEQAEILSLLKSGVYF